jgi:hypothetical protein
MKVGDKFLCKGDDATIEIVDAYYCTLYGQVVYSLKFSRTNTIISKILLKTIMDLIARGLAIPCNKIEPIKSLKRLKLQ